MKRSLLSVSLISLLGLGFSGAALASDGTITFNGSIVASTCDINGNGTGSGTFAVNLPPVSTTALAAAGTTAGRTGFNIKLTNCNPSSGNVHTYFEPGPDTNAAGRLNNHVVGGAGNVNIQVLNDTFQHINLNAADGSQSSQTVPIQSGSASLQYYAEYFANNGAATAGAVQSTVTYSLIYQ